MREVSEEEADRGYEFAMAIDNSDFDKHGCGDKGGRGDEDSGGDDEERGLTAPAGTHPPPSSSPTAGSLHARDVHENSESGPGNGTADRVEEETEAPTRRSGRPTRGREFRLTKACRCNEVVTEQEASDPTGAVKCNKDGCESIWVSSEWFYMLNIHFNHL
jgi:hypothetical protein